MRGAGMLRVRTGTICLLVLTIGHACGLPLQILPSIPGYIPVYIRNGDQPLIEINPALAEAFHETDNHSKLMRNMQLDRIRDQQNPDEKSKTSPKIQGSITEEKVSEKSEKMVTSNIQDSQSNDDINKIIGPSPQFINAYDLKENTKENGKSNIMKISRIPEIEKGDTNKLSLTVVKEESRPNDLYDVTPKISTEPEEVQLIKVSIVSDPLDVPILRQAKND